MPAPAKKQTVIAQAARDTSITSSNAFTSLSLDSGKVDYYIRENVRQTTLATRVKKLL